MPPYSPVSVRSLGSTEKALPLRSGPGVAFAGRRILLQRSVQTGVVACFGSAAARQVGFFGFWRRFRRTIGRRRPPAATSLAQPSKSGPHGVIPARDAQRIAARTHRGSPQKVLTSSVPVDYTALVHQ
jgi:hypothetical protein